MSQFNQDFRNSEAFTEIKRQLKTLWEQHNAAEKTDPAEAKRLRAQIGLLHGQLAEGWHPGDSHDYWCVWCERVSVQPKPLDDLPHCRYDDCDPLARLCELMSAHPDYGAGVGFESENGQLWSYVREKFHPEYPETAEVGKKYAVPEIPIRLEKIER